MSELNDPELEELERRVSAAFAGTRPRRGFEDELWARLERRRGLRVGSWRLRAWPALGALAAVLVIGLSILAVPHLTASRSGGEKSQTSSAVPQPARGPTDAAGGASSAGGQPHPQQGETAAGSFGRLPAPALAPPVAGAPAVPGQPVPYYGPARLTVTAKMPSTPAALPVYRYRQPGPGDLDAFAAQLGASRAGVAGTATIYRSSDFRLDMLPASSGQEPRFAVSAVAVSGPGQAGADGRQVADAFLSAHPPLRPAWPSTVQVQPSAQGQTVVYQREFDAAGSQAGLVDAAGSPGGLRVELAGGGVTSATGPVPVTMEASEYRSRPSGQAAADAVAAPSGVYGGRAQAPSFQLSKVSLVYMAAGSGEYGYFVPAYLFTGTASVGGATREMRVVVPALDPSQLG
jgi:hypothetical protein